MTREEAIKYAEDKFSKGLYRLDLGYLNRGLYQITAKEVDFLRVAIAALREQPQWISVEERLPEPFVSVLVYMPDENPFPTVHEGFLAKEGMWYANHFDRDPLEITHWMPMPKGPEEEV